MNINEYALDDDIVAIATALAPAAISLLRTSGSGSFERVAKIFSRPQKLLASKGNEVIYGWLVKDGEKIDEVILCTYRAPKSFTGEDSVEIMCHGGLSLTLSVLKLLRSCGFRQAKPGEFSFRSFISGKSDLTKAEAINEIIDAKSEKLTQQAASRLSGGLYKKIKKAKDKVLATLAELEVSIEYPEDDGFDENELDKEKILEALSILESILENWETQKIFTDGAKIVLAGRPNSGKSKLFNAIINEERAIVSDVAGTTRDWLETSLSFKGLPVTLYDTAGLRFTTEQVEKIGIENTKLLSETADLILYLVDGGVGEYNAEDADFMLAEKYAQLPKILVFTKADLIETCTKVKLKNQAEKLLQEKSISDYVLVSALEHFGLDELVEKSFSLLVDGELKSENITVGSQRQKNATESAIKFLKHALKSSEIQMPADAIVFDLEEALHFLGEITGEIRSEDILTEVFSNFCVGK
ncbi:MAG: tRNA uridine-5-carboxymethylaminomethyl(34) synthesis GTPase MnmE [Treponemataceae bacterium]